MFATEHTSLLRIVPDSHEFSQNRSRFIGDGTKQSRI